MAHLFRRASSLDSLLALHVRVVEARDLESADANGFSDPYVKVKVGGQDAKEKSRTVPKSLHPVWNFDSTFSVPPSGDISFEVYDEDSFSKNDFLGYLKFDLGVIRRLGTSGGWFRLRDKTDSHATHGRIFVVFAISASLEDATEHERASILYHATQQVVQSSNQRTHSASMAGELNLHHGVLHASHDITEALSSLAVSSPSSASSHASTTTTGTTSDHLTLELLETLDVLVAEWNVGNAPPQEELETWLEPGHDVYAIGVQECSYELEGSQLKKLSKLQCGTHFLEVIQKNLGDEYVLVTSVALMEIRNFLFARKSLVDRFDAISSGVQATGLAGVVGNKGGAAISCQYDDVSLCFVTAHLAAHQDRSSKRNEDAAAIVAGLTNMNRRSLDLHHGHTHVFFGGDLNYRLNWGTQGDEHSPTAEQFAALTDIIHSQPQRLPELFASDQLVRAMHHRAVLVDFTETQPTFKPTFKVARTEVLEYKDQRSPAWCDRVLWRCFAPQGVAAQYRVTPVKFQSAPGVGSSDHKPVFQTFKVPIVRMPLGTDFLRGALTVRFTRIAVHRLSAYAAPNPLVKIYAPFLANAVHTKHKNTGSAPSTPNHTTTEVSASGSSSASATTPTVSTSSPSMGPSSPPSEGGLTSPLARSGAFLYSMAEKAASVGSAMAHTTKSTLFAADVPTGNFTWEAHEIPLVHSQVNNIDRLRTQHLILKVLNYAYEAKIEKLVASTRLDLSTGADGKPTNFQLELEYGGLPCGKIEGTFQLEWTEANFTPLTLDQVHAIRSLH